MFGISEKPWRVHSGAMRAAAEARRGMGGAPYAYWACSLTGVDGASKLTINAVANALQQLLKHGGSNLHVFMPYEIMRATSWQNDPPGLFCFDTEMVYYAEAVVAHLNRLHPSYGVGSELQQAFLQGKAIVPWCTDSIAHISPFTRGQLLCAGVKQLPEPSGSVEDAAHDIVHGLNHALKLGWRAPQ